MCADNLLPSASQGTDLIIRCPLSRFNGVSMTGSPFPFRSFLRSQWAKSLCALQHQTAHILRGEGGGLTLQLRLYPPSPRRLLCNTLLHLARMPGIVCIASCKPWKQRVRRDEKKEREAGKERVALLCMHLLYIVRAFLLYVSLKFETVSGALHFFPSLPSSLNWPVLSKALLEIWK